MEQVTIRTCVDQDLDAVAELERQWEQEQVAYGDFNPLRPEGLLAALERFPTYFLVAERDDQLLGYIRGSWHQTAPLAVLPPEGACLEIEDLYVRPDVREGGVGQDLLERLLTAYGSTTSGRSALHGRHAQHADRQDPALLPAARLQALAHPVLHAGRRALVTCL